jgi:peptidyl-prolyl cis-trans isomerase SurA
MNRYAAFGIAFVLTLAGSAASSQDRELGASGELLDGIAALVDDGVVLKSELEERLDLVIRNFRAQQQQLPPEQRSQLPPLSVLEGQVLDQLILEQIQVQRADRLGIEVGDDVLNEVLSRLAGNMGNSLADLPALLAQDGIDYATFREQQRQELKITQLERRDVLASINITPRELEQCLARTEATQTDDFDYNVSHILVGFSPDAGPDEVAAAEKRVQTIIDELDAGTDFAQLALTYSDSQTALQGGALGWRKGSELPTIFADVVVRMKPGEHSDPIRTASGIHLVKLNEMRGAEPTVVDQVHARHILLAPNEILDDDATRQKLIGIRNQILSGDDFAAVASAVSEDSGSAVEGGDLGWAEPDAYVDEFRRMVETLEVGKLSEPFRSPFGWHIVEVLERRTYDTTEELKEQRCRNDIGNSKADEERELWLRRLHDQAYIVKRI